MCYIYTDLSACRSILTQLFWRCPQTPHSPGVAHITAGLNVVARDKRSTWLPDNRATSAPVKPHLSNHDIVAQGSKMMRRYFAAVDESSNKYRFGATPTADLMEQQVRSGLVVNVFCLFFLWCIVYFVSKHQSGVRNRI